MPRDADLLPDWFVGGAGKRRLLLALTDSSSGLWTNGPTWSERELAAAAGLSRKNAVGRHLLILEKAGLLVARDGLWQPSEGSPLTEPLTSYLEALQTLPEEPLPPSRGGH